MTRQLLTLASILLLAVIWSGCAPQPVTSGSAPDFTLDSLSDGAVTLSDLEGQVVVLDFWATWCNPCAEGLDHLQRVHERYAELRELPDHYFQACPSNPKSFELVRDMLAEVIAVHGKLRYLHVGADETELLGRCSACAAQVAKADRLALYLDYMKKVYFRPEIHSGPYSKLMREFL